MKQKKKITAEKKIVTSGCDCSLVPDQNILK